MLVKNNPNVTFHPKLMVTFVSGSGLQYRLFVNLLCHLFLPPSFQIVLFYDQTFTKIYFSSNCTLLLRK